MDFIILFTDLLVNRNQNGQNIEVTQFSKLEFIWEFFNPFVQQKIVFRTNSQYQALLFISKEYPGQYILY